MALLIFHLVLSSFTFDGVDVSVAQKIINWNLKRYPDGTRYTAPVIPYSNCFLGVFFLFGAGRLGLCRSQPAKAIEFYSKAMEVQSQYRNLHHVSFWEIAIANLALWDLKASLTCWRDLEKEATVSDIITAVPCMTHYINAVVEEHLLIWCGSVFVRDHWCRQGETQGSN